MEYTFTAKIRKYSSSQQGSWYFVTVPQKINTYIKKLKPIYKKRWRWSIKVHARIARLDRQTSIFPDTKTKSYLLPIKLDIRKKLYLVEDTIVTLSMDIVGDALMG
jgi:hypothetical protein